MKTAALIGTFLIYSLGWSLAQAAPHRNPPLFWPEQQLMPIQVDYKEVMADGLEFTITEFSNSELPLYSPLMDDWKQVGRLTHRNASVAFANNRNPSIKSGISLIRASDWLGELSSESLDRYVASLRNLHPNRFKLLNSDSGYAPIQGSGFLAGNPYKMVHYQITSAEDPAKVTEIRDFISQMDDYLLVVSFESPQSLASRNSGMALTMVTSLSHLADLE